jgi:hypothetical protein
MTLAVVVAMLVPCAGKTEFHPFFGTGVIEEQAAISVAAYTDDPEGDDDDYASFWIEMVEFGGPGWNSGETPHQSNVAILPSGWTVDTYVLSPEGCITGTYYLNLGYVWGDPVGEEEPEPIYTYVNRSAPVYCF